MVRPAPLPGGRPPNPYDLSTWNRDEAAPSAAAAADGPTRPARVVDERILAALREVVDDDRWPEDDRAEAGPGSGRGVRGEGDEEDPWDPPEVPRDLVDPFELARRTVNQSRAGARDRGLFPISAKTQARDVRDRSATAPGYSGARPDPRDPQGIESVLRRVLGSLGWQEGMSSGRVLEEWDAIVGEQIAAHCRPVSLDAGVLLVSASSSAWATQLRMLTPQLVTRIHEHVGAAVVAELRVTGPAAQSWKKGRRTVTWRGPRDTYG